MLNMMSFTAQRRIPTTSTTTASNPSPTKITPPNLCSIMSKHMDAAKSVPLSQPVVPVPVEEEEEEVEEEIINTDDSPCELSLSAQQAQMQAQFQAQSISVLSSLLYHRDWDGVFDVLFDEDGLPLLEFHQSDNEDSATTSLCLDIAESLKRLGLGDMENNEDDETGDNINFCLDPEVDVTLSHEQLVKSSTSDLPRYGSDNLLHALCQFQPPLDLVVLVTQEWPYMAQQRDSLTGQFPLHRAALYGCTSKVVKHLLEEYAPAAMGADHRGQLPLHLACRPIQWQLPASQDVDTDKENAPSQAQAPIYIHAGSAVIRAFCEHSPQGSNVEDCDGCNPLEIAIDHGLSKKICQLLLETSEHAWKDAKQELQKQKEEEQRLMSEAVATAARARVQTALNANRILSSLGGGSAHSDLLRQPLCTSEVRSIVSGSSTYFEATFKKQEDSAKPTNISNGVAMPLLKTMGAVGTNQMSSRQEDSSTGATDSSPSSPSNVDYVSLSLGSLPPYSEMLQHYRAMAEQKKQGSVASVSPSLCLKSKMEAPMRNLPKNSGAPRARRNSLVAEVA